MESARFLIVGGGTTEDAAIKGIREHDAEGSIILVEHWREPNRQGTVAHVDEARRPRGLLDWNVWDQVERERELIRGGASIPGSVPL